MNCQIKWFACSSVAMQTMTVLSPKMKSSKCLSDSTNNVSKVVNAPVVIDLTAIAHSDRSDRNKISVADYSGMIHLMVGVAGKSAPTIFYV